MAKPLSARAIETMRPGDKPKTDAGEHSGLRVYCGANGTKSFIYRYRSPETDKLTQIKIGDYRYIRVRDSERSKVSYTTPYECARSVNEITDEKVCVP